MDTNMHESVAPRKRCEMATQYAIWIGDTPVTDEAGNVIVQDGRGRQVAKLKPLKVFSE